MKLRNKKTGEIIDVYKGQVLIHYNDGRKTKLIKSLDELKDWEDYKEPKDYWVVDYITCGVDNLTIDTKEPEMDDFNKQIGNYFETREEAEKAVEKLKIYNKLKQKGFKFIGVRTLGKVIDFDIPEPYNLVGFHKYERSKDEKEFYDDLLFLFGGE